MYKIPLGKDGHYVPWSPLLKLHHWHLLDAPSLRRYIVELWREVESLCDIELGMHTTVYHK